MRANAMLCGAATIAERLIEIRRVGILSHHLCEPIELLTDNYIRSPLLFAKFSFDGEYLCIIFVPAFRVISLRFVLVKAVPFPLGYIFHKSAFMPVHRRE